MAAARLETLAQIEAAIWRELASATARTVSSKRHPWRLAVLASTDGQAADARTVVLRELLTQADAAVQGHGDSHHQGPTPSPTQTHTLLIYTDSRSPKAAQVAAHPQGTLVLWSPDLGWQLRLKVALSLHTTGLQVSSRWAQVKLTPAAQDYLSPLPPGSHIASPIPDRQSRGHFAVLAAQVQSVDWLELQASGHRRARFDARGAAWLTP